MFNIPSFLNCDQPSIKPTTTTTTKMASSSKEESLIEEKLASMVSPCGGKPFSRTAHFLKPSFPQTLFTLPPKNHLPTKPISEIIKFHSKVQFYGWRSAPWKNWNSWVERMRALHEQTWRKASVFKAIMASKVEIPKCHDSLFVFGEKWCPETSSFVLPWGEVSITLEDIRVLGGYSITGDSVLKELCSKELLEIEEKLLSVRSQMIRSKHKKASQQQWMEIWMEKGSEIEHEAFLSLWLSRYVLPADDLGTINKSVPAIAVLLAKGTEIALAPAVLASIYRDLRLFKEKIESFRSVGDQERKDAPSVKLWGPMQLLQAWIWERFPDLSPKPNRITGGVRLERWNKVSIVKTDDVGEAVDSAAESFLWRPYSTPLNNWSFCANLYPEKAGWLSVGVGVGFDLESYARCIRTSELVGLEKGCVEKYLPHRVAMQFGLDQDIPCVLPCLGDSSMIACTEYDRPILDVRLYVPSRLFEADVTVEYLEWWKKSKTKKENVSCPFQGSSKEAMDLTEMLKIKKEINELEVPPGFEPIGKRVSVDDLCDLPSFKRSKRSPRHVSSKTKSNDTDVSSHFSPLDQGREAEDDSDDRLTLSQLVGSKCSKRADSSNRCQVIDLDSPLSSAGDNESLQEVRNNAGDTSEIQCTTVGLTTEVGITIDDMSPRRSAVVADKRVGEASFSVIAESPRMNLLNRMASLQRIVNKVIALKKIG